jgi:hypothetical protein
MAGKRGSQLVKIPGSGGAGDFSLYGNQKTAKAAEDLKELDLFYATRVQILTQAAYKQGVKDGARTVFESIDKGVAESKDTIKHLNPGRPKKATAATKSGGAKKSGPRTKVGRKKAG